MNSAEMKELDELDDEDLATALANSVIGDSKLARRIMNALQAYAELKRDLPSSANDRDGERLAYRAALDQIIADENCDPVQIAHQAITPYTEWRATTPEETAAIDAALLSASGERG